MTNPQPLRVLIVDDHSMVRLALAQAIQQQPDLTLVGEAENGARALELYRQLRPDLVTMDYKLPDCTGDEATAALRAEFPDARIVLLSILETQESIWRATEAGALGYVSKSVEIDEVIAALRAVAAGENYYSHGLADKLAARRSSEGLSPRELEVLTQIVAGASNKEIMAALHMSQSTVKHHLERIFAKLGVNDRTQAVTAAVQRGIVLLDD